MMNQRDSNYDDEKSVRSEEEKAAWNRYMRNFRSTFKEKGLKSLSTVIKEEHSEFIDHFGRAHACQSKREALMMILDDARKRFEDELED